MGKDEYNFVQATPTKKKKKHTVLAALVALFIIVGILSAVLPTSNDSTEEDVPITKVLTLLYFL